MHRHGFFQGYHDSIHPEVQTTYYHPRVTNGKTFSMFERESEWAMLRQHLNEPSTSSDSSLTSDMDYILLDPWTIRRQLPVESKLKEPRKVRVKGDLIENPDPVPEQKKAASKPVIPSKELNVGVISRYERLQNDFHQEILEMQLYKSKFESDGSNKIKDDFAAFCQPETRKSYVTMTKDGLDSTVYMKTMGKEYCRVLYIRKISIEELKKHLIQEYRSFKGIRALSETEKSYCPYHPEVEIHDSYELWFGEPTDGQLLCGSDRAARLFPVSMDEKYGEDPLEVQLNLRWSQEPLAGRVIVTVKKDFEQKTKLILESNTIGKHVVDIRDDEEDPSKVKIEATFYITRDFNGFEQVRTQDDYQYIFEKIMEVNEIPAEVELVRSDPLNLTFDVIRFKINQRICRSAINSRSWYFDTEPFTDNNWKQFLTRHNNELKWAVSVDRATWEDDYQTATVKFTDREFGEKIIEYMSKNLNAEHFRFNNKQKEGVAFYPHFSEKIYVPRMIRWMCNSQICALDDEMREDSNMLLDWARLTDLRENEEAMKIEGSSHEIVEIYKQKLAAILKGVSLDCSSTSCAQLLFGCGLQWVNFQQKKNASKVLISVDRLNEKIHFFGAPEVIDRVKNELLLFVLDPHNFVVSSEIAIGLPKFLPVMTCVLDSNGERLISSLLGGCEIGFAKPNKLIFKGTVHQYNNLKLMLDTTQYNVMDKYTETTLVQRAKEKVTAFSKCAVCLNPHSYDKFRLGCGHSYCLQCLTRLIQTGLKSNELPLRCAFEKCGKNIALNNIMSLLFDDNSFKFKEFFADRLAPFNKAATIIGAKKGDLPCCIKAGCEGFCPKEGDHDVPATITCPLCKTPRCSHCPNPPHDSRSCQQEAELRGNDQLSIEHYIKDRRDNVKQCPTPNCQALIQKEQGCNHMQCTFCKMHFCWLCLFSAPTQNLVYAHMQNIHGTAGGEWAHIDFDADDRGIDARIQRMQQLVAEMNIGAHGDMNMGPHGDFFGIRRGFFPVLGDSDDEW